MATYVENRVELKDGERVSLEPYFGMPSEDSSLEFVKNQAAEIYLKDDYLEVDSYGMVAHNLAEFLSGILEREVVVEFASTDGYYIAGKITQAPSIVIENHPKWTEETIKIFFKFFDAENYADGEEELLREMADDVGKDKLIKIIQETTNYTDTLWLKNIIL